MADSDRKRSSLSPSPRKGRPRSVPRQRSVSRSRSPERLRDVSRSPERLRDVSRSPERRRDVSRSPERRRDVSRSPERLGGISRSAQRFRDVSRSPLRQKSVSPSPQRHRPVTRSPQKRRSVSRSRSRSRSYGRDEPNPGNTLFVTGLSSRVTDRDLQDHFSKEGKVSSVFLVVEPRTRISRGFAFVNMDTLEDAERCIKYLNQSILEGRYITVEKSRRKRPRTPTPGHYLGLSKRDGYRGDRGGGGGGFRGGYGRDDYDYRRSPRRSSPRRGYSPRRSPSGYRSRRERSRSHSPYDSGYGRRSGGYGR